MDTSDSPTRLLVYGGSGYVGTKVLELAVQRGATCVSVSRTGQVPLHLKNQQASWVDQVTWRKGDACQPAPELFTDVDVVITLVGSAPVPTFSKAAFQQQVVLNGSVNCAVIEAAQQQGVKQLVLMSAHIPKLMQSQRFGYFVGKQLALQAAKQFGELSAEHSATVLYPSAIYGTRHTAGGLPIPLAPLMGPVAWIMGLLPQFIVRVLPESPVSLHRVASSVVEFALSHPAPGLTVVENQQLLVKQGL
jgi:nucleoside-diphosphate-sugar epimerase